MCNKCCTRISFNEAWRHFSQNILHPLQGLICAARALSLSFIQMLYAAVMVAAITVDDVCGGLLGAGGSGPGGFGGSRPSSLYGAPGFGGGGGGYGGGAGGYDGGQV